MRLPHMLRGRDSLIPEVPRSRHVGWTGMNVKPNMQSQYFDRMVHNTQRDVQYKGEINI